jgi:hypothetical protein
MPGYAYGWWKDPPKYVGDDPRNYVLTVEELKQYEEVLAQEATEVTAQLAKVRTTRRAMEKKHVPSWESTDPRPITLCSVLEHRVRSAKADLEQMKFLLACTEPRKQEIKDELSRSGNVLREAPQQE